MLYACKDLDDLKDLEADCEMYVEIGLRGLYENNDLSALLDHNKKEGIGIHICKFFTKFIFLRMIAPAKVAMCTSFLCYLIYLFYMLFSSCLN